MTAHRPDDDRSPSGGTSESAPAPPRGPESSRTEAPGRGEEPVATGTLFIMILFLMALVGMWGIMYLILLER